MTSKLIELDSHPPYPLFLYEWIPESPKAILQIVHGMVEHAERYKALATFLNTQNIGLIAMDLRGHGHTGHFHQKLGHLSDHQGASLVVNDCIKLSKRYQNRYPKCPYFLLGHSMGSYIVQHILMTKTSLNFQGCILSGTSLENPIAVRAVRFLTGCIKKIGFGRSSATLLQSQIFGKLNRYCAPTQTDFDWLSKDTDNVNHYIADPLCGFTVSYAFYHDLFSWLKKINKQHLRNIRPTLPLLFLYGQNDPLSQGGKTVKKLRQIYTSLGFNDIQEYVYKNSRHEVLNDIEKKHVFEDLADWITAHC